MNFLEAVKAMKEGKKVKFNEATYWEEDGWIKQEYEGKITEVMSVSMCDGNIWKVEEKKTLSDKIISYNTEPYKLKVEDVKEHLKEFIEKITELEIQLNPDCDLRVTIEGISKEIFGDELISKV